jgi:hypothetical protein
MFVSTPNDGWVSLSKPFSYNKNFVVKCRCEVESSYRIGRKLLQVRHRSRALQNLAGAVVIVFEANSRELIRTSLRYTSVDNMAGGTEEVIWIHKDWNSDAVRQFSNICRTSTGLTKWPDCALTLQALTGPQSPLIISPNGSPR